MSEYEGVNVSILDKVDPVSIVMHGIAYEKPRRLLQTGSSRPSLKGEPTDPRNERTMTVTIV